MLLNVSRLKISAYLGKVLQVMSDIRTLANEK